MSKRDILRRARRSLAQAKTRTILTSLAIAVGAFTVTLSMAAGEGGRQYTEEMVKTAGDRQSLSVFPKQAEIRNDKLPEFGAEENNSIEQRFLSKNDITNIKSVPDVVDVIPMRNIEPQYATRGESYKKLIAPVIIKVDHTELKLSSGSLNDNMIPIGGMTISQDLLSSFDFGDASEAIGQTITLHIPKLDSNNVPTDEFIDKSFKIVAVDRSSDATLYYERALRISVQDGELISNYQNGNNNEQYDGLVVEINKSADVKTVQDAIANKNYQVYSMEDIRSVLLQMVNIAQWGMVAFGTLAILASVFGIVNTQYISVLERTQQIGLMKALGMSKGNIGKLFRYEAAWVGFLGGTIGTVFALLVGLANPMLAEFLELDRSVKVLVFLPQVSFVIIASMVLIAVMAGIFPSRKASKLDPIEALRTE